MVSSPCPVWSRGDGLWVWPGSSSREDSSLGHPLSKKRTGSCLSVRREDGTFSLLYCACLKGFKLLGGRWIEVVPILGPGSQASYRPAVGCYMAKDEAWLMCLVLEEAGNWKLGLHLWFRFQKLKLRNGLPRVTQPQTTDVRS